MSSSSPSHRYSAPADLDVAFAEQQSFFTAEISNRMRVPSKILVAEGDRLKGGAEIDEETIITENHLHHPHPGTQNTTSPMHTMRVPDRILLAGGNEHVGVRAPPRELRLEQGLTPEPSSFVRVETPPRVLTLEDHCFPTVDDEPTEEKENEGRGGNREKQPMAPPASSSFVPNGPMVASSSQPIRYDSNNANSYSTFGVNPPDLSLMRGGGGARNSLSSPPLEEMDVLRRHVVQLSRRMTLLEEEAQLRQQREMVAYSMAVAYFLFKTLLWLHRHW